MRVEQISDGFHLIPKISRQLLIPINEEFYEAVVERIVSRLHLTKALSNQTYSRLMCEANTPPAA